MKRNSIVFASLAFTAIALLFNSCSKDDTSAPIVTLNGNSSVSLSLNSSFSDPGATANDDKDGSVTVTVSGSVDKDTKGSYTLTYSATDGAGNVGTATRVVTVSNDAESWAGTYAVHDTCPGVSFNYAQTITSDLHVNKRIHFNKFANYANNTNIYADVQGGGTLNLPSQSASTIGSGSGACDIADHTFVSVSSSNISNGFILIYSDQITSPSTCIGTTQCTATFTK